MEEKLLKEILDTLKEISTKLDKLDNIDKNVDYTYDEVSQLAANVDSIRLNITNLPLKD